MDDASIKKIYSTIAVGKKRRIEFFEGERRGDFQLIINRELI